MIKLTIDGLTVDEFLNLSPEEMNGLVFCGRPVAFRVGSAEILGEFRKKGSHLEIELAHIEGGGEGALPLIWRLASVYADREGYSDIDWFVHAVNCANPNPKLRRVLERKGFEIQLKNQVEVFYLNQVRKKQALE